MRLYDNDAYREEFMALVYDLLHTDGTNDRANQIIDAFDMAPEIEAELLPQNVPLTLEELREMDGEPVWVNELDKGKLAGSWAIVARDVCGRLRPLSLSKNYPERDCGVTWLAYRRRTEEEG